jgi:hypothetical protein
MLCVTSLASCSGGIEKVCVMGIRDRIIYVDENKYELLLEKFKQKKKKNVIEVIKYVIEIITSAISKL